MKKSFFNPIFLVLSFMSILFSSCEEKEALGFTGPYEVIDGDTVRFTIPEYEFYNQDSVLVTNKNVAGKVHVIAFFFTSCPTMCPVITQNLHVVHKEFKGNDMVHINSISINPDYDNCTRLRTYADGFDIDTKYWSFLRKDEAYTHDFIQNRLYQSVVKDPNAPGGFDHSSRVLLVDQEGRLRKFYVGTDKKEIEKLITDIETLLQ